MVVFLGLGKYILGKYPAIQIRTRVFLISKLSLYRVVAQQGNKHGVNGIEDARMLAIFDR